jgi:uncharacterized membrane protein HdeD (DUF308 family)
LALLGLTAIFVPFVAGVLTSSWLGCVYVCAGVVSIIAAFRAARSGIWVNSAFQDSGLALFAGILLIWNPMPDTVTLAYVLMAYFIADGILTIMHALGHIDDVAGDWQWMALNGLVDFVLAGLLISGLTTTLVWLAGFLVGFDMVFGGLSLIAMSNTARRIVMR